MKKIITFVVFFTTFCPVFAQTDSVTVYLSRNDLAKKQPVEIFVDGKVITTLPVYTEYKVIKITPGKHAISAQYKSLGPEEKKQTIARRTVFEFPAREIFYFKTKSDGTLLDFVEMSKTGWIQFSQNLLEAKD